MLVLRVKRPITQTARCRPNPQFAEMLLFFGRKFAATCRFRACIDVPGEKPGAQLAGCPLADCTRPAESISIDVFTRPCQRRAPSASSLSDEGARALGSCARSH